MLDPFNDDRADAFVRVLARQKTLTPARKVLQKAIARSRSSWLDDLPLCQSALAAAATVAIARGWPDKSPVPDRLINWLAKTQPQADDELAALAAEFVAKLRSHSILWDIAEDVQDRSFQPGCTDLIKRLKKRPKADGLPRAVIAKGPADMSPAEARKDLERKRYRFERVAGLLTPVADDESSLSDANLAILARIDSVGRVNLGSSKSRVTATGLAQLLAMPNLQALGLRHIADDALLAAAGKLPKLRELGLYYAKKVDDQALRRLAGLKGLEELDLGCTSCDGRGLVHVPASRLKTLHLSDLKISPQGAKAIGRFKALEELKLSYCKLPKGFFRELAGLKRLARLDLSGVKGLDASVEDDLGGLSPKAQAAVRRAIKVPG